MTKSPVLLDSSVWIEILGGGALAARCEAELSAAVNVLVPTVVLFEVYRKVCRATSEEEALSVITMLSQHTVSDLSREIALEAADLSIAHKLAMADSLVLAHARHVHAVLVTLDNDFADLSDVRSQIYRSPPHRIPRHDARHDGGSVQPHRGRARPRPPLTRLCG